MRLGGATSKRLQENQSVASWGLGKPRLRNYERDGRRGTMVKGHGASQELGSEDAAQGEAGQGRGREREKGLPNAALLWVRVPGVRGLGQRRPVSLWSLGRPEAVDVPVGQ